MIHDADAIFGEHGDVAIRKKKHFPRMFEQSWNVTGDEILAVSQSDNRRRPQARSHYFLRIFRGKKNERVNAAQFF
jgi:hypothetical protein